MLKPNWDLVSYRLEIYPHGDGDSRIATGHGELFSREYMARLLRSMADELDPLPPPSRLQAESVEYRGYRRAIADLGSFLGSGLMVTPGPWKSGNDSPPAAEPQAASQQAGTAPEVTP